MLRILSLCIFLLSSQALAAGFYATELGARSIGRAGADVVNPKDGYAVWRNPAALANMHGVSFTTDVILVQLNLEYQRTGPFSLPEHSGDYGGYRYTTSPHADIDPTDIGLSADDDWQRVFSTGKYKSEATAVNKASPFVFGCESVLGGGFDGRGHCPIVDGILVLGDGLLGVPGLALSLASFGPPTGGYWFWDESMGDASKPEGERYLDANGFDKRFVGPQRYTIIDREVLEAFYQLSAAYRLNRYLAVGVGLQAVESGLRMRTAVSVDTFGSEDPTMDLVINIKAHAAYLPSANIGFWSNPWGGLHVGGSYQLARPVTVTGPVTVDYKAPGLDDFVIDDASASAVVRFNMPAIARLGLAYEFAPWFDLETDFIFEQWSSWANNSIRVDNLNFTVPGLDPVQMPTIVQPKAYRDAWSVRLGGDVDPLASLWPDHLTLRGGVLYETSAIPVETLDASLIDAEKFGIATGIEFGYMGIHLRAGYEHRFLADVTVNNSIAATIAPLGDIFGYETRTAAANGVYKASFDVLAFALTLDVMETIAFFADEGGAPEGLKGNGGQ